MTFTQMLQQYGWFFGIPIAFLVVVWYVFRPKHKKQYEQDARIPLEEDHAPHKK